MTTIKTFIKPTQTLKLAILALSFGSTLAVAGDMNPERLISSVRPGDKIVMFNKPNPDAPVTAESKAIEFSEGATGSGVFAATFVKGKKFGGAALLFERRHELHRHGSWIERRRPGEAKAERHDGDGGSASSQRPPERQIIPPVCETRRL